MLRTWSHRMSGNPITYAVFTVRAACACAVVEIAHNAHRPMAALPTPPPSPPSTLPPRDFNDLRAPVTATHWHERAPTTRVLVPPKKNPHGNIAPKLRAER